MTPFHCFLSEDKVVRGVRVSCFALRMRFGSRGPSDMSPKWIDRGAV